MKQRFADVLLILLAMAPFYAVYTLHWLNSEEATGFIQYDMPYYSANGREVFERGNGFAAANPYDPQPDAPAIYVQWFPWLLGVSIKKFGIPPEVAFCTLGLLAGFCMSWLTLLLVRALLPDRKHVAPLYLFAMLGGGILALSKLVLNFLSDQPPFEEILLFDFGHGWWFFTWGRNLLLPTEALYHAFVAGAWYCVLQRREWIAVGLTSLLAATHPFTGVQHLLVLGSWNLFQLVVWKDRQALFRGLALTAVLALFLWYYFGFLESFPQHRELRETWTLNWSVPMLVMLFAYGPVAFLAAIRLLFWPRTRSVEIWFFVVAAGVSALLIKHDLFITPHQPLHFTRGYVWMPLFLLAIPVLQHLFDAVSNLKANWKQFLCTALLFLAVCFDNLCFLTSASLSSERHVSLPRPVREIFRQLDETNAVGVLLCPDENLSYLSATFTSVRPYFGHKFNTPNFEFRKQQVLNWATGHSPEEWLDPIDFILLRPEDAAMLLPEGDWHLDTEINGYRLYRLKSQ